MFSGAWQTYTRSVLQAHDSGRFAQDGAPPTLKVWAPAGVSSKERRVSGNARMCGSASGAGCAPRLWISTRQNGAG